jgi:hypothetical protein
MYSKVQIYNLALGALLLNKRIADVDTDTSTECQTLNIHYQAALVTTLEDLDLDGISVEMPLELIQEEPNDNWLYVYKYPSNCAFFRRIQSTVLKDTRVTQIARRVGNLNNQRVIYTDQQDAIGEYIPIDVPLNMLSASAGLAVAYKLAILSAPLISGKAALTLRKSIQGDYLVAKAEAMEKDRLENANFESDEEQSEFVQTRTS